TVASTAASNLTIMQMELGSNNPAIVCADADVEETAKHIVQGMTKLNGQWCEAPRKILVNENIHKNLVIALEKELNKLLIGDATDNNTDVGPLAFEKHRAKLLHSINRLKSFGGTLISAKHMPRLKGWF